MIDAVSYGSAAERLHDAGWTSPLPLRGKRPLIREWQQFNLRPMTPEEVAHLACSHTDAGIGLAVPAGILAIDIDIRDTMAAARAQAAAEETIGRTPLVRIGQWPKRLLIFRAEGAIAPRRGRSVELFHGSGQVVLYGTHPSTGRPYYWPDDDPLHVGPAELPTATPERVEQFLALLPADEPPVRTATVGSPRAEPVFDRLASDRRDIHSPDRRTVWVRQLRAARPGELHNVMLSVSASMVTAGIADDEIACVFEEHFAAPRSGAYAEVWQQLPGAITGARSKYITRRAADIDRLARELGLHRRRPRCTQTGGDRDERRHP